MQEPPRPPGPGFCSHYMLIHSVLGAQALLSRLTSQDDIVVGTPHTKHGQAEAEALQGCYQ